MDGSGSENGASEDAKSVEYQELEDEESDEKPNTSAIIESVEISDGEKQDEYVKGEMQAQEKIYANVID